MFATGGVLRGIVATRHRQESSGGSLRSALRGSSERRDSQRRRARRRRRLRARRRRPADAVVVRGKVQMCSLPGVVACLGLLLLLVGITMTVMGYWPRRRVTAAGFESSGRGNGSALHRPQQQQWWSQNRPHQDKGLRERKEQHLSLPARGSLATFVVRHLLHSERMKLLGPLLMGVGIFVFICANAVLHENRDRETRIIHLRDIYSTVIDENVRRANKRAREDGLSGYEAWLTQGRGELAEGQQEEEEEDEAPAGGADLTAGPPRGAGDTAKTTSPRPFAQSLATTSLRSFVEPRFAWRGGRGDGKRSARGAERRGARSIVSPSVSAFTLPVIKLNNCVIDEGIDRVADAAAAAPSLASAAQPPPRAGIPVGRESAGAFPPPASRGDESNDGDEEEEEEEEMSSRDNPEDGLLHDRAEQKRGAILCSAESRVSLSPAVAFLGKLLSPALGRRRPPPLAAAAAAALAAVPQAAWDAALRSRRKSSSDRDASCAGRETCAAVSGHSKSLDLSERDAFHVCCSAQPQQQHHQQQQQQRMKHPSWPRLQERAASYGGAASAETAGAARGSGVDVGRGGRGGAGGGGAGAGGKASSGYVKLQAEAAWSDHGPEPGHAAHSWRPASGRGRAAIIMSRSHSNYSFELDEREEPGRQRGATSETTF